MLGSGENDSVDYLHPEVEKIDDMSKVYYAPLKIGDFVECKFQDYKWCHGQVADLSEDGTTCKVLYHGKDVSRSLFETSSDITKQDSHNQCCYAISLTCYVMCKVRG